MQKKKEFSFNFFLAFLLYGLPQSQFFTINQQRKSQNYNSTICICSTKVQHAYLKNTFFQPLWHTYTSSYDCSKCGIRLNSHIWNIYSLSFKCAREARKRYFQLDVLNLCCQQLSQGCCIALAPRQTEVRLCRNQ